MMGKPDMLDRVAQGLILLVAVFSLAFGFLMLSDPYGWYQMIATVKFTGPPNDHFIRDIGLAYAERNLLGFSGSNPSMRGWRRWQEFVGLERRASCLGSDHRRVFAGRFLAGCAGLLGPPLLVWRIGILFARQRISPAGVPDFAYLRAVDPLSPGSRNISMKSPQRRAMLWKSSTFHARDAAPSRSAGGSVSHGADRRDSGSGWRALRVDGGARRARGRGFS